jgi:hypothetical protein
MNDKETACESGLDASNVSSASACPSRDQWRFAYEELHRRNAATFLDASKQFTLGSDLFSSWVVFLRAVSGSLPHAFILPKPCLLPFLNHGL